MKNLMIDLDDVICDNQIVYYANQFLGTNYKFEDIPEGYDFSGLTKDAKHLRDLFHYFVVEHDCYENATLKPDCYDVLKDLQANYGYNIFICSACLAKGSEDESVNVYANKYRFIRKHLPFVDPNNIIFTNAKGVVYGDIMIDDRLKNLDGNFGTKLLFDCWYNRKYTNKQLAQQGIIRVKDWQDIKKVLTKLK